MSIHDRGFASLSPARLAEVSAEGGRASHRSGHAHHWTTRTARKAGALGGVASGVTRRRKREEQEAALRGRDGA